MSDTATQEHVDQETGEVLTSKQITISQQAAAGVKIGGVEYGIVNRVNLETLKQESGETVCVRIDAPIRIEHNTVREKVMLDGQEREVEKVNKLSVVRVTELSTMTPFEYVCNAMTADNLHSAYPDDGYVGRCFAIQKLGRVAGKMYKATNVFEIAPK